MTESSQRFGLSCAIATPFTPSGAIDAGRLLAHGRDLLARGCDGITVFGTTGEGPSVATSERTAVLGALRDGGIDLARQVVVGVTTGPVDDAIAQARLALDAGCRGLLVAPPFYFKDVPVDGVFGWFSALFAGLGASARDVILYHIPQFTGVPLGVDLVGRLKTAFPGVVTGVKDSQGDWANTERLVTAHRDLLILVGDESHVAAAVRKGGAGTICGFSNLIPEALRRVVHDATEQPEVERLAGVLKNHHFLGALKTVIAHRRRDPAWMAVRPPLQPLAAEAAVRVRAADDAVFAGVAA